MIRHLTDTLLFRMIIVLRGFWLVAVLTFALDNEAISSFHTLVIKAMGVNQYTQRYGFSGITGKSKDFPVDSDWFFR